MNMPVAGYLAAASSLLPTIVGLIRYRKLDHAMKVFVLLSVIGSLNISAEILLALLRMKNYALFDMYAIVSVPLFALVYHRSLAEGAARTILKIGSVVFLLLGVFDEAFLSIPGQINNTLGMISAVFLVVMSIVTLNVLITSTEEKLTTQPIFWILTGTILYYSGSFAVMGLSNDLMTIGVRYFEIGWHVNWILFLVSMLMYTKGLLCKSQA